VKARLTRRAITCKVAALERDYALTARQRRQSAEETHVDEDPQTDNAGEAESREKAGLTGTAKPLDPEVLAGERDRLVRLCLRFSGGNLDLAEDLAQETMIEAFRSSSQIRDRGAWRSWLSGIARNVCLRWARRHSTEQERLVRLPDASGDSEAPSYGRPIPGSSLVVPNGAIILVDPSDIDASLEHKEMARLLDRAMNQIPGRMRDLLVEHYVEELPQAEIAARRGIREETVAVQMHRGRKALRDALVSAELRRDAAEMGLIRDVAAPWQETHIWCPVCGKRRLVGRFDAGDDRAGEVNEFVLRCPGCYAETEEPLTHMQYSDTARLADVLRGVKGFKPALNRLNNWWHAYYQNALELGHARCLLCDRRVQASLTTVPEEITGPQERPLRAVFLHCPYCGTFNYADVDALSLWQPEAQEFWRKHGRIRVQPTREIVTTSGAAFLTRVESITSREVVDIVTSQGSLDIIEVRGGSR